MAGIAYLSYSVKDKSMRILHICNDLFGSKVHLNLYDALSEKGVEQVVFVPRREGGTEPEIRMSKSISLAVAKVVKPYHRLCYHIKRMVIYDALEQSVDLRSCDLIHATTLFSDGGVAYKAHQKYHLPYFVTVRNTDVNGFLRLLPHTWISGWRILLHADRIFFVSKAIMERFSSNCVIRPILPRIQDKFVLQTNGLDEYWCDHVRREKTTNQKVLYIGDFSDNKNVKRLIEAVVMLREENRFSDLTLTLVGGERVESKELPRLINQYDGIVNFIGEVRDKDQLCGIMREHTIFAMPSIYETFGLAYVEALSQNLAILYTKGQGVDGMFDEQVGIGVDPYSVESIRRAIARMVEHRGDYSNDGVDFESFRWSSISERYKSFYSNQVKK